MKPEDNKKIYVAETLHELIEDNPEITYIHLLCLVDSFESSSNDKMTFYYRVTRFDSEYSFIGSRERALEWSSQYAIWDSCFNRMKLVDGHVLKGIIDNTDPDYRKFVYPYDPHDFAIVDIQLIAVVYSGEKDLVVIHDGDFPEELDGKILV